jgi:hypothetical protein
MPMSAACRRLRRDAYSLLLIFRFHFIDFHAFISSLRPLRLFSLAFILTLLPLDYFIDIFTISRLLFSIIFIDFHLLAPFY